MVRHPRSEVPGATYHVTARGNGGRAIFEDDHDRIHLLGMVAHVVRVNDWTCFAYCLMDNHYHLLVRTSGLTLSSGMRVVQTRHAQRFNSRHGRRGHVFGDRFHARRVEGESHLLAAAVYVILNPVRAGLVARPGEWQWSSYRATLEPVHSGFLDAGALLELLSPNIDRARALYRQVVDEAVATLRAHSE
jgi:REP element-mobilizing transposase RayT